MVWYGKQLAYTCFIKVTLPKVSVDWLDFHSALGEVESDGAKAVGHVVEQQDVQVLL